MKSMDLWRDDILEVLYAFMDTHKLKAKHVCAQCSVTSDDRTESQTDRHSVLYFDLISIKANQIYSP